MHARPRSVKARLVIGALVVASSLAACGSPNDGKPAYITVVPSATSILPSTTTTPGATTTTSPRAKTLLGVCPSPVVIQLDGPMDMWSTPYAALAAADGVSDGLRYRAALLDPITRASLGIDVEIRTVGALPAGYPVTNAVLGDASVLLGTVGVDTVLPVTAQRPVVVAAPWARGDLALRWRLDSEVSAAKTIGDLAGTVIANPDVDPAAAGYLQASGLLPRKRDVPIVRPEASKQPGTTGEAALVHLLDDPVRLPPLVDGTGLDRAQLLAEVGWEPYPHALVTRRESATERQDCLRAIVPLVQRAVLRTGRQPKTMTDHLVRVASRMGVTLDGEQLLRQLQAALDLGLLGVGNEAASITADIAQGRFVQIAKAQVLSSRVIKPRLTLPKDITAIAATLLERRFIDSSITYDAEVSELVGDGQ